MQGFTQAPWRHWHAALYEPADVYFAPFMRLEHGDVRQRDLRDVTSPLNDNHNLVPQVIFRDVDELKHLVGVLRNAGFSRVDLNLGCPFPPQVNKGRGAALVGRPDMLEAVADLVNSDPSMAYSVKMRPGVKDADEWRGALPALNRMRLVHVAVHPRIARNQYSGSVDMDCFAEMADAIHHPIIYNGDIVAATGIDGVLQRFPGLEGVMVGRGLLSRPSMIEEWRSGVEWDLTKCRERILQLHSRICEYYTDTLCGDAQILSKIKPFWEYLGGLFDRKLLKHTLKSTSLASYVSAVESMAKKK